MATSLPSLVLGDALETLKGLPDNSCAVGVTSPPYNKQEKQKGWLVKNVKYANVSDVKDEGAYQEEQIQVLNELYRIIKPGGSFFYNHKIRWERGALLHPFSWVARTNWVCRQEIIWDRQIAANIRGWRFWQVDERIYWLMKPVNGNKIGKELESKYAKQTSVWRFPPERKNSHPAPFPLNLPLRCIAATTSEKGVVIDPYCGGGTTLVAAKFLNHDYIGIDMSEAYIEMSEERLKNYQSEQKEFENEIAKHQVEKSFKQRKEEGMNVGKFSPEKVKLRRSQSARNREQQEAQSRPLW